MNWVTGFHVPVLWALPGWAESGFEFQFISSTLSSESVTFSHRYGQTLAEIILWNCYKNSAVLVLYWSQWPTWWLCVSKVLILKSAADPRSTGNTVVGTLLFFPQRFLQPRIFEGQSVGDGGEQVQFIVQHSQVLLLFYKVVALHGPQWWCTMNPAVSLEMVMPWDIVREECGCSFKCLFVGEI